MTICVSMGVKDRIAIAMSGAPMAASVQLHHNSSS
jgi:hypothetical protein